MPGEAELRALEYEQVVLNSARRYIEEYAAAEQSNESLKTLRIADDLIAECVRKMRERQAAAERWPGTNKSGIPAANSSDSVSAPASDPVTQP